MRALLAILALALVAAPAEAATSVVTYKGKRAAFKRELRHAELLKRAVVLRKLPIAAVPVGLRRAARLKRVTHVERNRRLEYHLSDSAPLVFGGAEAREATYTAGFDGTGVNVAVIDTGIDGLHADFGDRIVKNVKFVGSPPGPVVPVECPDALPCNTDTTGGHGTHVAGIAVGDGSASGGFHRGVAPGAGVVGLSVGEAVAVFSAAQAMDYILAHPELNIVAVNNSYGEGEGVLFDEEMAVNVASRKLAEAGISVVFSAGNAGVGPRTDPEGASDCSVESAGTGCKFNQYGVAPWAISVANARSDIEGGPAAQPISFSSSRGDDRPTTSVSGKIEVEYRPTVTAPGINIWSARTITGVAGLTCGNSAEAPSCVEYPEHLANYVPISGTSMAAPHVTGAIAVLQSAAKAKLGRLLTPAEVKELLQRTATPMTALDGLWDFPCQLSGCGTKVAGTTGLPYEPWQNGAGFVDVAAAIAALPVPGTTPDPEPSPSPSPSASPGPEPSASPTPGASPEPGATPTPAPGATPGPVADRTAPVLRRVVVRRNRVRLTLDEPASIRFIVRRRVTIVAAPAGRSSHLVRGARRHRRIRLVATDSDGNRAVVALP